MTLPSPLPSLPEQFQALTASALWALLPGRTRIRISGADRAKFLHNLCTNDVLRLKTGQGCEAFFCNVQGKVLAHVWIFALGDALVLSGAAGQSASLAAHLDRYLIREKVDIHPCEGELVEILLAGPQAATIWRQTAGDAPPADLLSHAAQDGPFGPLHLAHVDLVGPQSYLIALPPAAAEGLGRRLGEAGAIACGSEVVEAARLAAGFPAYGRDITGDNLAQEVNRTPQAISFVKGCYLGQEPIARIDALGHVNRLLVRLRIDGPNAPAAGSELRAGDKPVGQITSSAMLPGQNQSVALAYIRRGHESVGARVLSTVGEAVVV